jgi:hypothetical protein
MVQWAGDCTALQNMTLTESFRRWFLWTDDHRPLQNIIFTESFRRWFSGQMTVHLSRVWHSLSRLGGGLADTRLYTSPEYDTHWVVYEAVQWTDDRTPLQNMAFTESFRKWFSGHMFIHLSRLWHSLGCLGGGLADTHLYTSPEYDIHWVV